MSFTSLVLLKDKDLTYLKQIIKNRNYSVEHYVDESNTSYYLIKTDSKLELSTTENVLKVFRVHHRNGVYFTINAVNFMVSKNLYVDETGKKIKWYVIRNMFKKALFNRILVVKIKYNNLQFLILKKV